RRAVQIKIGAGIAGADERKAKRGRIAHQFVHKGVFRAAQQAQIEPGAAQEVRRVNGAAVGGGHNQRSARPRRSLNPVRSVRRIGKSDQSHDVRMGGKGRTRNLKLLSLAFSFKSAKFYESVLPEITG